MHQFTFQKEKPRNERQSAFEIIIMSLNNDIVSCSVQIEGYVGSVSTLVRKCEWRVIRRCSRPAAHYAAPKTTCLEKRSQQCCPQHTQTHTTQQCTMPSTQDHVSILLPNHNASNKEFFFFFLKHQMKITTALQQK